MSENDKVQREVLPIPDVQHVGLTTFDAKDPDTWYPPIEQLRPPKGAPNVLVVRKLTWPVSGKSLNSAAAARADDSNARPNMEPGSGSGVTADSAATAVSMPLRTPRFKWRSRHAVSLRSISLPLSAGLPSSPTARAPSSGMSPAASTVRPSLV